MLLRELFDNPLNELNVPQTLKFIQQAHGDQLYGDLPYWKHPRAVAMTGKKIFGKAFSSDAVKVAFLHDVVEDTHIGLDELKKLDFEPEVIEAVALLTKDRSLTYAQNIEQIMNSGNHLAMMVKYADNYENYTGDKSSWDPAKAASSQKKYLKSLNMLGSKLGVKSHTVPLSEGGWDTTVTQGTVIKPAVVKIVLNKVQQFVNDFNIWLGDKGYGKIEMGRPTGSGAYHEKDSQNDPDKVYGDVDLQMIAPPVEGLSYGQYTAHWNKLADEFVKQRRPEYVHDTESKPGHPIIKIGEDAYVQVDFMWHEPKLKDWGASRVTPEHGVKGLLTGNMYSVMGEIMDMSIQHAGVQLKVIDDQHVPFSKQKGTTTITVTTNPKTYIYDIFMYLAKRMGVQDPVADPLLRQFPGNDVNDVKIAKLVNGVKGLAKSFAANGMIGKDILSKFQSAEDFVNQFERRYEEKAMIDVNAKKRDKAETPEAKARADADREKVLSGLKMVKGLFAG